MRPLSHSTRTIALAAALLAGAAGAARAQHSGNGYLFHAPEVRISLRGGYAIAAARSDLFDFTVDELTLNKRDFSSYTVGGEVGVPVADRFEIVLDLGYSRANRGSEFRHFVDNKDLPIEQSLEFIRTPITANVRYYVAPPGRAVGKLAWIPAKLTPWIGAGAGTMYYSFRQRGDFVDFETTNVFYDDFESGGFTPVVQGIGGFDLTLTPSLALTTDARFLWARGRVSSDYSGFDKIDLSGAQVTVGLTLRM